MKKTRRVRVTHKDPKVRARIRRSVLRHKLDRRFVYTVCLEGILSTTGKFTGKCSGCEAMDGSNFGCSECGHTGKRVTYFPEPVGSGTDFIHIKLEPQAGDTDGR